MISEVRQLNVLSLYLHKRLVSKDGTEKYIWATNDKHYFETAFVTLEYREIPRVICVSSQIGCPLGCTFCATGKNFVRNLTDTEITLQVTDLIKHKHEQWICSENPRFEISFMAMGEPLLNWDNVKKGIQFFDQEFGDQIEVTVSTVGIVPQIYQLGMEPFNCKVDLQLSLHSANPIIRQRLIPSQAYTIEEVIRAGEWYSEKTGRKVCINYLLLKGVNDSEAECQRLINLLDPGCFYVKLSRLNAEGNLYHPSEEPVTKNFELLLRKSSFEIKLFKSRGADIGAGCGQLVSELTM